MRADITVITFNILGLWK